MKFEARENRFEMMHDGLDKIRDEVKVLMELAGNDEKILERLKDIEFIGETMQL